LDRSQGEKNSKATKGGPCPPKKMWGRKRGWVGGLAGGGNQVPARGEKPIKSGESHGREDHKLGDKKRGENGHVGDTQFPLTLKIQSQRGGEDAP